MTEAASTAIAMIEAWIAATLQTGYLLQVNGVDHVTLSKRL